MRLNEYKIDKGYTYQKLADELGIGKTLAFNLCSDAGYPNLRLTQALQIEKKTNRRVRVSELCTK